MHCLCHEQPFLLYPPQELFSSQIGPTKSVTLAYNAKGHSTGVANVTFSRVGDGTKAFEQYNGRLIDGS